MRLILSACGSHEKKTATINVEMWNSLGNGRNEHSRTLIEPGTYFIKYMHYVH